MINGFIKIVIIEILSCRYNIHCLLVFILGNTTKVTSFVISKLQTQKSNNQFIIVLFRRKV